MIKKVLNCWLVVLMMVSVAMAQESPKSLEDTNVDDDTLVGVIYFAGWWKEMPNKWHGQGWNAEAPDWRLTYPERVPLLGEYNVQDTMDREIAAAADHGVDFFQILYYFPQTKSKQGKHAPMLNRGLETYLASPNADKMQFCIEYCNAPDFSAGTDEEWNAAVATWVEAMKHPSYLRVDGRLVFKVHGISQFLKTNNNDYELCQKRLDTLRDAVRDASLGEMIIGVGVGAPTPPLGLRWPPAELFDFTATYMGVPKDVEAQETDYPYATLAEKTRTWRENRVSDPLPWMPYLAAGWNPRPWTYPTAPAHYQRFFEFPTRAEFTDELKAMKESLDKHPSLGLPKKDGTQQKAFTIYAWNEFGEGGIVAPTQGNGTMMLECIENVFGDPVQQEKITIGLIGDSTMASMYGWGPAFADKVNDRAKVYNYAKNGATLASLSGKLDTLLQLEPDYVFIQFGHNDQKRYDTQVYKDKLKSYADRVIQAGAKPVIFSSVTRRNFDENGKIAPKSWNVPEKPFHATLTEYAQTAQSLAKELDVLFIDLHTLSIAHHNTIGPEVSATYNFVESDTTHFSKQGAEAIAGLILEELRLVVPEINDK